MKNDHILTHYDEALNRVSNEVVLLGQDVFRHMEHIYKLIDRKDEKWGNRVIGEMDSLATRQKTITISCHDILARFHPVASDLRMVIGLNRCAEKLEEAIRQLGTLARRGKLIIQQSVVDNTSLLQLIHMACNQMNGAVLAVEYRDKDRAKTVKKDDKLLDQFHYRLIEETIANNPKSFENPLDVDRIFFIRAVERIGDDAKGMANAVAFM